jgi:glycosyltransferase involved in cell wall biosynthesis
VDKPRSVKEGTANRLLGLYSSMADALVRSKPDSIVYWYSNLDHTFRKLSNNNQNKLGMLQAVFKVIRSSNKSRSRILVMIAYPSVFKSISVQGRLFSLIELLLSIIAFKVFTFRRAKVIVDNFDPPVELNSAFSETEPFILFTFFRRTMDNIFLRAASLVVVVTNSYKNYISKLYKIPKNRIIVVPNGAFVQFIPYVPTEFHRPLRILYSGTASKTKGVDQLVHCISKLREKGIDIELEVAGAEMNLPCWVQNIQTNWLDFINNILVNSDICVIPYPPAKLHFTYTMPAKLADYMAAGKPIVSSAAKETALILRQFDCGLVAKNWDEFGEQIERLYLNYDLALRLGRNGRIAAETNFNYPSIAELFLQKVIKEFKMLKEGID